MYSLTITNTRTREALTFNDLGDQYRISEIQGLNPPAVTVNTDTLALRDGAVYNSARVQVRQLNIAFSIMSDPEAGRLRAYRVLSPRTPIEIRYTSETLDVYAEGYVQAVPVQHFAMRNTITASLICPDPYWRSVQEIITEMAATVPLFHFPFYNEQGSADLVFGSFGGMNTVRVENPGGIETGLTIEMYFRDATGFPKVRNLDTGALIGADLTTQAGDLIVFTTYTGNKTATLTRAGVTTSILDKLTAGSTWLQLGPTGETFSRSYQTGTSSDFDIVFRHRSLYTGV